MPPTVTLSESFLGLLVTCALKGTMFLLLVGVLALFCPSASRRHFIWMCGFALLGALLVLEPIVPQWAILPNWEASGWMAALRPWIFPVWSLGAALFCAKVILGLFALVRIERRSTALEGEPWDDLLNDCREELGIRRPVKLLKFPGRIMPMTWGVLRNCVVLPSSAMRWSGQRIRAVLMHELAHIRRRDYMASLFRDAICAFYWFHPLVWWAAREMDEDREEASDDAVIAAGQRPGDYAEHLTTVATRGWGARVVDPQVRPKVALAEKPLIVRVRSILAPWKSRHPITWGQRFQLATVLSFLLSVVLFVGPDEQTKTMLAGSNPQAVGVGEGVGSLDGTIAVRRASHGEGLALPLPSHLAVPVEAVPGWRAGALELDSVDLEPRSSSLTGGGAVRSPAPSEEAGNDGIEALVEVDGIGPSLSSSDGQEGVVSELASSFSGARASDAGGVVAPPNEYSTSPPDEVDDVADPLDIGEVMASFENVGHVDFNEFNLGELTEGRGSGQAIEGLFDLDGFEFAFESGTQGDAGFSVASLGSPKATALVNGPEANEVTPRANLEKSRGGPSINQRLTTVKDPIVPELPAAAQNRPDAGLDVHVFFLHHNATGELHLAITYTRQTAAPTAKYRFEASADLTGESWDFSPELFTFAGVASYRDRPGIVIVLNEPISESPYRFLRIRSSKSVTPTRGEE